MNQPFLVRIRLYPLKSLDYVPQNQAFILPGGALKFDREWAIIDEQNKFVNAKRFKIIHLLRSRLDLLQETIDLKLPKTQDILTFHLIKQKKDLENCLSQYFDFPVRLINNKQTGFPDDTKASGPTIISTATIKTVCSWFPEISEENMRLRFRANLEIDGVPAFWEDKLFNNYNPLNLCQNYVQFKIGDVTFHGINPCKRCIVPTRDPLTGFSYPNFQKIFSQNRQANLPSWTNSQAFKTWYSLATNTYIPPTESGKSINIGDKLRIF